MTTLQWALEHYPSPTHDVLRKAARLAFSMHMAKRPHALHTVPGSLAHTTRIGDSVWSSVHNDDGKRDENEDKHRCRPTAVSWNVPLWSSKVGGFGFLPRATPYPTSTIAPCNPLQLVAQVNFGELWAQAAAGKMEVSAQQRALWPERGILAFYVDGEDDLYGCTFKPKSPQEGYRILYFDEELRPVEDVLRQLHAGSLDVAAAEAALAPLLWSREEQYEQFKALDDSKEPPPLDIIDCLWESSMISQEFPFLLDGMDEMVPQRGSDFCDRVAAPVLTEHPELAPPRDKDTFSVYNWQLTDCDAYLTRPEGAAEDDEPPENDMLYTHVGGYPFFTQDDPRGDSIDLEALLKRGHATEEELQMVEEKDVLLLQLTSIDEMRWGDDGACNLFISSDDLKAKRFDKTWYNWDCY